jgi:hypothetical protein
VAWEIGKRRAWTWIGLGVLPAGVSVVWFVRSLGDRLEARRR